MPATARFTSTSIITDLRSGGGFWGYLEYHGERATPLLLLVVLLVDRLDVGGPAGPGRADARRA